MKMDLKEYFEAAIVIAVIGILHILCIIKKLLEPKP